MNRVALLPNRLDTTLENDDGQSAHRSVIDSFCDSLSGMESQIVPRVQWVRLVPVLYGVMSHFLRSFKGMATSVGSKTVHRSRRCFFAFSHYPARVLVVRPSNGEKTRKTTLLCT